MADGIIYAAALEFGATVWTQEADFKGLAQVKFFSRSLREASALLKITSGIRVQKT